MSSRSAALFVALAVSGGGPCFAERLSSKGLTGFPVTIHQKSDLYPLAGVLDSRCGLDETLQGCDGVRALTLRGRATLEYLALKKALADKLDLLARWEKSFTFRALAARDLARSMGLGEDAARGLAEAQEEQAERDRRFGEREARELREMLLKLECDLLIRGWALRTGGRLELLAREGTDFAGVHYWPVEEFQREPPRQ